MEKERLIGEVTANNKTLLVRSVGMHPRVWDGSKESDHTEPD